jgi:hypothetical protein
MSKADIEKMSGKLYYSNVTQHYHCLLSLFSKCYRLSHEMRRNYHDDAHENCSAASILSCAEMTSS